MILTRAYWCHAAGERDPGLPGHIPRTVLAPSPELALEWMRDSVRAFAGVLDHRPFVLVRRWLSDSDSGGDSDGMADGLRRLRGGDGYSFGMDTELGPCVWSVHPVLELPLLGSEGAREAG